MSRPPFFNTPEELQEKITNYFSDSCEERRVLDDEGELKFVRPVTISGLSLYLGFADRHSFYDYEKKPEFTHTIKMARARITQHYEEISQGSHAAGPIFMLKNLGYADKQEVDWSGSFSKMPKVEVDGVPLEVNVGEHPSTEDTTSTE